MLEKVTQHQWLDWLMIAAVGLALQSFWAARMTQPTYMDAYYYAANGQRLADGFGFSEEVVWQFLDQPGNFPVPSHTYWMPLTSILASLGYQFSSQFRAAQVPFWLLAGLLPILAYGISLMLRQPRWVGWVAALFTASGGFYNNFYNQPSTFAPFAWAGGFCLLALAKGSKAGPNGWWFAAGLMAGLGHLTRADGVLLLGVGGIVAAKNGMDRRQLSQFGQQVGLLAVGYFMIMGGWFVRNWLLMGRPLPTVGTQTIFLTTYDDLFAYGRSFDLSSFLAWGWPHIVQSRLAALAVAAQTFVAINCLIFLTPLVVVGWWQLAKKEPVLIRPLTIYAVALYFVMSIVFAFPGARGGLFHSSAALFPWMMSLAAAGIPTAVEWTAQRLPHWQPARAGRIFAALFVGVSFIMSVGLGLVRRSEVREAAVYVEIGAALPQDAVVMSGNAPGFYYHTGLKSVSVPNESPETVLQAADEYRVSYLILDQNRPDPLDQLYIGEFTHARFQLLKEYEGYKLYQIDP